MVRLLNSLYRDCKTVVTNKIEKLFKQMKMDRENVSTATHLGWMRPIS